MLPNCCDVMCVYVAKSGFADLEFPTWNSDIDDRYTVLSVSEIVVV